MLHTELSLIAVSTASSLGIEHSKTYISHKTILYYSLNFIDSGAANTDVTNPVAERVADSQFHILMWKQRCAANLTVKCILKFTFIPYNILEYSVNRTHPQRDPAAG